MARDLILRQAGWRSLQALPLPPRPSHLVYPYRVHDPGWHGAVDLWRGYGFGTLGIDTTAVAVNAGSQAGQAAISGSAHGNMGQSLVMSVPSIAGGVISSAIAATASAATTAIAVPIIGVAVAGVTILLSMYFRNQAQKVAATKVVDSIEPFMQKNLAAYMAGPHTISSQMQALNNFDAGWAEVTAKCADIGGGGGQRCVTDRQEGACKWQDSSGCWNWFSGYRDPIANDPLVHPDPIVDAAGNVIPFIKDPASGQWVLDESQSTPLGALSGIFSGIPMPLLLAAGALVLALSMGGSSTSWVRGKA